MDFKKEIKSELDETRTIEFMRHVRQRPCRLSYSIETSR